jgi:hypothetical protein
MKTLLGRLKIFDEYKEETCIIMCKDQIVFTSKEKGVKPMMDYYEEHGRSDEHLLVIDRIMGKGAVILADLIGANQIITPKISEVAVDYAHKVEIEVFCEKIVPYIINRTGDGRCPIESAVIDVDETKQGYQMILQTLASLRNLSVQQTDNLIEN